MASYTNVPDSVLEPGDPIRSVDIIAIKDNIEHYAENNGTTNVFTSPGTWSKPATVQRIKVTVVGGGGGKLSGPIPAGNFASGGGGGSAIKWIPAPSIPGPVSVTRGAGASGSNGGTSSFGAFCSATGGIRGTTVGGAGGGGSGGDLNISGGPGAPGPTGAPGGPSILGAGSTVSQNGGLHGGGAGPGPAPAALAGGNGVVIVEEFY